MDTLRFIHHCRGGLVEWFGGYAFALSTLQKITHNTKKFMIQYLTYFITEIWEYKNTGGNLKTIGKRGDKP